MFDFIKSSFKKNDRITLICTKGTYTGVIQFINDTSIVLKTDDGKILGIKGDDINFFETDDDVQIIENSNNEIKEQQLPVVEEGKENSNEYTSENNNITNQENHCDINQNDSFDEVDKPKADEKKNTPYSPIQMPCVKVVGKLTEEQLKEMEKPKIGQCLVERKKTKFKKLGGGLDSLSLLVEKDHEIEGQMIIPANGVVEKLHPEGFGFILDQYKQRVFFHTINCLEDGIAIKTPVIFSLTRNYKGDKAICIHKPKTIQQTIKLAEQFLSKNDFEIALNLTAQILKEYPENYLAFKLKNDIEKQIGYRNKEKKYSNRNYNTSGKETSIEYEKAKQLQVKGYTEEAILHYLKALENGEKMESCIKDIATSYGALYKNAILNNDVVSSEKYRKLALQHMGRYESELTDNLSTLFFLENFFYSISEYEYCVEILDEILENKHIGNNKQKYILYSLKKAAALLKQKKDKEARETVEDVLDSDPNNISAKKLLSAIDEQDDRKQNESIDSLRLDSLVSGYSKFIEDTLEQYTAYKGVPLTVIEKADFTPETLSSLRKLIDTAGRSRPKERAEYLLSEAKLMQMLEPEQDIRTVLARYCNAKALVHISDHSPIDVIRSYYLDAFRLEEKYNSNAYQLAKYLLTYCPELDYGEILNADLSVEQALNKAMKNKKAQDDVMEGLLSAFMWNSNIMKAVVPKLYELHMPSALRFFNNNNISCSSSITKEKFMDYWDKLREIRQNDNQNWFGLLSVPTKSNNLDVVLNGLVAIDQDKQLNPEWLSKYELKRLHSISTNIVPSLEQFIRSKRYREKERCYENSKAQICALQDDIKKFPTRFSYEGLIPLLENTLHSLEKSYQDVVQASCPEVQVRILGEAPCIDGNKVTVKVKLSNSLESSPIHGITVTIQNSSEIKCSKKMEWIDTIEGGESCELHIPILVSEKVLSEKATTVNVMYSYRTRNHEEPVQKEEKLSLRLYSGEEFIPIPNPYEQLANGGPVTDTKMFYGRNEFIRRITDAISHTDAKQVVIYGQKRSGKSSVLYHLKKSLEDTGNTFCVSFSIGDIYDNLSTSTFFYKILSMIEEELENLRFDGVETPEFHCPKWSDFSNEMDPGDSFRKSIKLLKRSFSQREGWGNKKLVIMIDEFTYIYSAIRKNLIPEGFMKQWKAITQNEDSAFSSVLVGQDVFPLFKDAFPNEFGVTQDERLTYLSKIDAEKLIVEPIGKSESGGSRFIDNALDTIIDYTSCNPYYIQIFCARLVAEMNRKKYKEVTSADVEAIADSFVNGGSALTDDKFDNLLNAGEAHDISINDTENTKTVLKIVAKNAKNIGFCLREQIEIPEHKEINVDDVLRDLVKREVLEKKEDKYKIQVKLFQQWLLKQ